MIELIAYSTMIVDHIGKILCDDNVILRSIGRISLPAFLVMMSVGIKNTRNIYKYLTRLLILALISQYPYMMVLNKSGLNIIFTLIFVLIASDYLRKDNLVGVITILILSYILPVSYGIYGVLSGIVICDNKLRINDKLKLYSILTIIYVITSGFYIQLLSIIAYIVIVEMTKIKKYTIFRIPKYIKYAIYPLHLYIFMMII